MLCFYEHDPSNITHSTNGFPIESHIMGHSFTLIKELLFEYKQPKRQIIHLHLLTSAHTLASRI